MVSIHHRPALLAPTPLYVPRLFLDLTLHTLSALSTRMPVIQ